jgi:hypothetical protein
MATGAVVARILTQYSDKGSKAAQKDIAKLGKRFDDFSKRAVKSFGLAAAASAAFAVKIGVDAVKGAMEDQKQQIALATALRNTTGATDEAIAATVTYLDKLELLVGVDNNQLIPSLQILTQATKDVTAAQQLQALALDISAGRTLDLGAVSLALAKAIGGNVGALTRLGVPLDADAVKAKDLNAILKSLGATFAGQAEKRAQTFEFRLIKLQLAFNQIIDQLGYALIPVLEKFAIQLSTKILPQIQTWVSLNKDKLVDGLEKAANATLKLFGASLAFGEWVVNNIDTIKTLAIILSTMWATSKVYAFAKAVGAVTLAFKGMQIAALGGTAAGAVGGTAAAAAGAIPIAIAAGIGALTFGLSKISPGEKARAKAKTAAGVLGSNFPMSPGASDVMFNKVKAGGSVPTATDALQKFIDALNAANKSTKTAKTLQDKINAEAVRQNLARQAKLSGSSTIAIGGSGSLAYGNKGGTTVIVNNAGSVISSNDLISTIEDGILRTTRRDGGGRVSTSAGGMMIV